MAKRPTTREADVKAIRAAARRERIAAGADLRTRRIPDARKAASRKACRGRVAY